MKEIQVVGIDCSAQQKDLAVALAKGDRIEAVEVGLDRPVEFITAWHDQDLPLIVAIDAPLGWPAPMARELPNHTAGSPIEAPRKQFFSRETDRFVHNRIGVKPLDVGAERIAKTAHRALEMVDRLRSATERALPLLWDCSGPTGVVGGTLEVYPAATLKACGLPHRGYKKDTPAGLALREEILSQLECHLRFSTRRSGVLVDHNKLDAIICVLAAHHYLAGDAMGPPSEVPAPSSEGWIWVRHAD